MSRYQNSRATWTLVLLLSACATPGTTVTTDQGMVVRTDEATTRAELARLTQRFVDAMKASDIETPVSLWTEDAWAAPPGAQPVIGREGLRRWFRETYANGRITNAEFHPADIKIHGDYAYESGHFVFSIQPSSGGAVMNDRGHYFVEWHRGADGQWRARREVWNSEIPASPAR